MANPGRCRAIRDRVRTGVRDEGRTAIRDGVRIAIFQMRRQGACLLALSDSRFADFYCPYGAQR